MTPPDLTPEQMNERLVSDFCALIENRCGTVRGIGPAVREGLPKLFAAWQEQTAAKAGEPPHVPPDQAVEDALEESYIENMGLTRGGVYRLLYVAYPAMFREGAAAGVAASEARVRELRALIRDLRDTGECYFDHHGYCQAHGWMTTDRPCPHGRAAALLSEEPA